MTHFRMFVRAAPIGLLICTLVIASATGEELSPREIFIRSVDDVAPALRNATTTALSGAQSIVASSSDLLIAAAIRKSKKLCHNTTEFSPLLVPLL